MSVITASKFNAKNLTTSDIKKLDNGSSQVYINYDGKRLRVQAPQMSVPYDAGDYQGNEKFKVQFSFKGKDTNPKLQAYFDMLEAIDDFVIDVATKNAGKWFKMPGASRDTIALFYARSIKYSKDKEGNIKAEYPPTQAVALKKRSGAFDAELYDDKNQLMEGVTPVEVLRRGAEVIPICDATGIWVADKKFGLTWKLHQAAVKVPGEGSSRRGFAGVDEDEEDAPIVARGGVSAKDEADLMAAVMPGKKKAPEPVESEDDEEEQEEEEDEDEVVQPVPVPAKKAVAAPAPAPAPAPAAKKVVKKVSGK